MGNIGLEDHLKQKLKILVEKPVNLFLRAKDQKTRD